MPFRVGLTGGIGCGKSTISMLFASLGVPVLDSDQIARELVQPGSPTLAEITATFGHRILLPDGHLDRRQLRRLIFDRPEERERLEAILHPRIRTELQNQSEHASGAYVLLVIPLLIERGWRNLVDRILVVDCAPETQVRRVQARDHASDGEVRAILKAQASREARLAQADEIIHNEDTDLASLEDQVNRLDSHYRQAAASQSP